MISRQSGGAKAAHVAKAPATVKSDHRSSPRITTPELAPGDMGYTGDDKTASGGVTREEMVKLFGNALRVR